MNQWFNDTRIEDQEFRTLVCPKCGFDYLHHDGVEVFCRAEDAGEGLHVTVTGRGELQTDADAVTNNPSARRDGLRIHFWCENCDCKPWFEIQQHKGQTLWSWDATTTADCRFNDAAGEQARKLERATESPMEHKFLDAMRLFPSLVVDCEAQKRIGIYRVDFAFPLRRLVVEIDGHEFHSTKEAKERDVRRDRALMAEGWRVMRFTGTEVYKDAAKCVAEVDAVPVDDAASSISTPADRAPNEVA